MKSKLKSLLIFSCRWGGAFRLWHYLNRKRIVILTLHGVMDAEAGMTWVPLRPQLPRKRLDFLLKVLAKWYRFVSLEEAVEMLAGRRPVLPNSLVLTFDDGYRNNLKYALPILRLHGAPATFFLSTGHVDRRRPFWFDRLDYALQHVPANGREVRIGHDAFRAGSMNRSQLQLLYKRFREDAKAKVRNDLEMQEEMDRLAGMLESEGGGKLADILEEDDWSAVMTWDEIRGELKEDVCFGSHTVDHNRLGMMDRDGIREQLLRSREAIERNTGRECRLLCYPSGSHSETTAEIARECGYLAALTTVEGTNRRGDDLMTLKRINFPIDGGVNEMLIKVSGLSNWMHRIGSLPR